MFHERTTASTRLSRERVTFSLGSCDLIQWDQKVPSLKNAKGGDFYLYRGFILYRAAREAFSIIEYQDVRGIATNVSFIEEEKIPPDSKVIGQSWATPIKMVAATGDLLITTKSPSCNMAACLSRVTPGSGKNFNSRFAEVGELLRGYEQVNRIVQPHRRLAEHRRSSRCWLERGSSPTPTQSSSAAPPPQPPVANYQA